MFFDEDEQERHILKIRKKRPETEYVKKKLSSPFEEEKDKNVDSTDMLILNQLISLSSSDKESGKNKKKKKKKDKSEKKSKETEKKIKNKEKKKSKHMLDVFDDIFDDETSKKPKKNKNRDAEDFYEQRFRGSLMLLKGLMQEVNETALDSKDHIRELKRNPARGSSMAIANQSSTVSTLLNTKLSIIKEITAVNKSISDLELRQEGQKMKAKTETDKAKDSSAYLDDMFDRIMNNDIPLPEYDDDDDIDKYSRSSLSKRVDDLMNDGTIEFNDSERAFKYEAMGGVEIAILYDTSSKKKKKWEFVALTEDGQEINDYPLPSKRSCGKMDFDLESDSAKDKLGNIYKLIYVNDEITGLSDDFDDDEDYE